MAGEFGEERGWDGASRNTEELGGKPGIWTENEGVRRAETERGDKDRFKV